MSGTTSPGISKVNSSTGAKETSKSTKTSACSEIKEPSSTLDLPALQGELWQQEHAISLPGTLQNVSIPSILNHLTILPHPLNRRLHKSTAVITPQNRRLRKSTAVSPQKSSVTQSTTDTPSPVESNTPKTLESTVNAFTAITTTAVPHTSTFPTTKHPGKSSVPHTLASLTFKNPAKSMYDANDLHEIDSLHEINSFEHGY
ncbi:hypothetical protein NA56DRAFT_661177 [Hyaloscypha hepaticicola]|uniref:Uncharacterized protein n=1 Tax=Hyaloscypha hepaticicola TaxID=2082293 RepID=A0A2J6PXX9_9HELO|nr:hypothetical protein NA56DRAFT_661177 [Hyaloscypha hepaticicola]